MAKAVSKCICQTCGKEFEFVKILRNCTEANKFKSWAETNIVECYECRKERNYLFYRQKNDTQIEDSSRIGWPELTGTVKQVEWASSIREKEMSPIIKSIKRNESRDDIDKYKHAVNNLLIHTRADWWISNRGHILAMFRMEVRKIMSNSLK